MNNRKSFTNIFNKDSTVLVKIGMVSTLITTMAITFFRTLAYFFFYDKDIGYFVSDNPISAVVYILTALGIVIALAVLFIPKCGEKLSARIPLTAKTTSSSVLAIGACVLMIINHISSFSGITDAACIIAFVLACAYFSVDFFPTEKQRLLNGVRVICGYALLVGLGISITNIYFDRYVPMNNPDKVILIFSILFNMLYLIAEYRFLLGIPKKKIYISFSLISILLGASFSISYLIADIFGALKDGTYLVYAFTALISSMYILIRSIEYLKASEDADEVKGKNEVTQDSLILNVRNSEDHSPDDDGLKHTDVSVDEKKPNIFPDQSEHSKVNDQDDTDKEQDK